MTIKEIAELCGVDERTVLRWAHKVAEKASPAADILSPGTITADERRIAESIKKKLENSGHGFPGDYDLNETISAIGEGGENKTLASLLAENAANKNALAVQNSASAAQNDISARLDRIETAIIQLSRSIGDIRQSPSRKTPLLKGKHDKERSFYDFIGKNIVIKKHFRPIKRVDVWERYIETVKKADRMKQNEFFERLCAVFPTMDIARTRIGPFFQFFCYGISLAKQ